MKKRPTRINRPLSDEERTRIELLRQSVIRDQPKILSRLNELAESHERRTVALREALKLLREARQSQGVSLPELSARTGIGKGALSRLENAADPNPTLRTLQRVALALNKQLVIGLVDTST